MDSLFVSPSSWLINTKHYIQSMQNSTQTRTEFYVRTQRSMFLSGPRIPFGCLCVSPCDSRGAPFCLRRSGSWELVVTKVKDYALLHSVFVRGGEALTMRIIVSEEEEAFLQVSEALWVSQKQCEKIKHMAGCSCTLLNIWHLHMASLRHFLQSLWFLIANTMKSHTKQKYRNWSSESKTWAQTSKKQNTFTALHPICKINTKYFLGLRGCSFQFFSQDKLWRNIVNAGLSRSNHEWAVSLIYDDISYYTLTCSLFKVKVTTVVILKSSPRSTQASHERRRSHGCEVWAKQIDILVILF